MKNTDLYIQLDTVLSFFKNSKAANAHVDVQLIHTLYNQAHPELQLSEVTFLSVLQRLIKDHFVMRFPLDAAYYITNDGREYKGYQHAHVWHRRQPFKAIKHIAIFSSSACVFVVSISWVFRHLLHH